MLYFQYIFICCTIYMAIGITWFLYSVTGDYLEKTFPQSSYDRRGVLIGHLVVCLLTGPFLALEAIKVWLWKYYIVWIVRQYIRIKFKEGLIDKDKYDELNQKIANQDK